MIEVEVTGEFERWYEALDETDTDAVYESVSLLEERGVALGYPHSSQIKGSRYALRELRVQSKGRPIRIVYAFDPRRRAVLLLGAEKLNEKRFYKICVPRAEKLWEDYLNEPADEGDSD